MFRLMKNNVIVFLFVSAIIILVDALLMQSLLFVQHAEVLGAAIVADFVLVIPLLLYFLVYRKIKKPLLGVLPFAIAGYFAILLLKLNTDNVALAIAKYALLPLEIAFIGYELYKLYRIVRTIKSNWQPDVHPMDTVQISLQTAIRSSRLAAWLLQEISVFYYAFLAWRKNPYVRRETAVYTYHENSNALIIVLFLSKILLLEGAVIHFLLAQWSPVLAWVLSLGNVWFIVLLVANYRAMRLNPILMDDRSIHIQYGIQLRVEIEINNVASVKLVSPEELKERREKEGQAAIQPHGVEPNVRIRLKDNLVAYGLFASQRSIREVHIFIDQPQVFLADCQFRMSIVEDSLNVKA